MSPDIHTRVRQLREQIHASPVIGSPIPFRPLNQFAYWRTVFRIRDLEARIVAADRAKIASLRARDERARARRVVP
jgi:hypothetical protein